METDTVQESRNPTKPDSAVQESRNLTKPDSAELKIYSNLGHLRGHESLHPFLRH